MKLNDLDIPETPSVLTDDDWAFAEEVRDYLLDRRPVPLLNVPLLRKELEFITANPRSWRQGTWLRRNSDCGTQGCLAGNTVLHAGQAMWSGNEDGWTTKNGFGWSVNAGYLLGLNDAQQSLLFSSENSLWDLWNYARMISHGEIQIPPGIKPSRFE